ncbi:MAG: transposase [Spirochaetaceae bacterium]|jgi:REP element-mobilizing transposase RayT|nr:transposase [Spirochaetaceae bacterium]
MRQVRIYEPDVWYEVSTKINRGDPLFSNQEVRDLFEQVLHETKERFVFELRNPVIESDGVSFYFKSADGSQLPKIMQWMKQTFAARFNKRFNRRGHVWGDRGQIKRAEPPAAGDGASGSQDEPIVFKAASLVHRRGRDAPRRR